MAAASNAEHTQLQDMEQEDAEVEEREMEDEDEQEEDEEDSMAEEDEEEDEEEDSSEDEKENEAEIQRLEEQVAAISFSCRTNDNEWMDGWKQRHCKTTSAKFKMPNYGVQLCQQFMSLYVVAVVVKCKWVPMTWRHSSWLARC